MINYVKHEGFVRFTKAGGWFEQTPLNQRTAPHTENGPEYRVLGSEPPHVMKEVGRNKPAKANDMFIDVGVRC
jgi:endoglucanase